MKERDTLPRLAVCLPLVFLLSLGACDLPTDATEARDRLSRGETNVVGVDLPLPGIDINVKEELLDSAFDFHNILDDDLNIQVSPDPFAVDFGSSFAVDVTNLDPIVEAFELSVDPFTTTFDIDVDPVAVDLPQDTVSDEPLPPTPEPRKLIEPLDFADTYGTVTFAGGSVMGVRLDTDAEGSITGVSADLKDESGEVVASSDAADVGPSSEETLLLTLDGATLTDSLTVEITMESARGDTDPDGDVEITVVWFDTRVTAAADVDASRVSAVGVDETVTLDDTGDDFTEATLDTGTLEVTDFEFGTLNFTPGPGFETNLAGKEVAGETPGTVGVEGTVAPPEGADRVDISTSGSVTGRVSDITVSSASLTTVDFDVDRLVDVVDENEGDLKGVEDVEVASGSITLDMENRMPVGGPLTITLQGTVGPDGSALSRSVTVPAASGSDPGTLTMTFDLAGSRLTPAELQALVAGTLSGENLTVTKEIADDAFTVSPAAAVDASAVTVENAGTDLAIEFENLEEFTKSELDLEGSEDLLRDVTLHGVELAVKIVNPTSVQLTLDSVDLELVAFPSGTAVSDAGGNPIAVRLQEGTTGQVVVPGSGAKRVTVEASTLVSRLVNRLSDDQRSGVRATGDAGLEGASGRIAASDELTVEIHVQAPLDLSIPEKGARIDRVSHDVVDLSGAVADLIVDAQPSIQSAEVVLEVTNPVPVGIDLDVALSGRSDDPFEASENLTVRDISIPPAAADESGNATESAQATVTVSVPTQDLDIFQQGQMSLGVVADLLPPESGRGRITGDEIITIVPTGKLRISTLGGS